MLPARPQHSLYRRSRSTPYRWLETGPEARFGCYAEGAWAPDDQLVNVLSKPQLTLAQQFTAVIGDHLNPTLRACFNVFENYVFRKSFANPHTISEIRYPSAVGPAADDINHVPTTTQQVEQHSTKRDFLYEQLDFEDDKYMVGSVVLSTPSETELRRHGQQVLDSETTTTSGARPTASNKSMRLRATVDVPEDFYQAFRDEGAAVPVLPMYRDHGPRSRQPLSNGQIVSVGEQSFSGSGTSARLSCEASLNPHLNTRTDIAHPWVSVELVLTTGIN
ncbi:unnamed protein product [Amoebophrya sp. A120]|nr:unnamed protein product [Amoebophrya sp. A120]|eukprot:GSA120T00006909001.1